MLGSSLRIGEVLALRKGDIDLTTMPATLRAGTDPEAVSPYVSPATATDLAGLPTTYLDAGSAEVFRDEVVDYASRIWASGGQAELHLWAGGFHGFDSLHPNATLSVQARRARLDWLKRTLDL